MTHDIDAMERDESNDRHRGYDARLPQILAGHDQIRGVTTDRLSAVLALLRQLAERDSRAPIQRVLQAYFFRQINFHMVGRVAEVQGNWLRLEDAAWIADSGRFNEFIRTGSASEVEPVGVAYVNVEHVSDAEPWPHTLPLVTK